MLLPPGIGERKKKVLLSSSVAAPLVSCGFLCYGAAKEFLSNSKTAAKTHMMLLTFYGNKT